MNELSGSSPLFAKNQQNKDLIKENKPLDDKISNYASQSMAKISEDQLAANAVGKTQEWSASKEWSVSKLMTLTEDQWTNRSTDLLNEKMKQYSKICVPERGPQFMAGFLEKHDLAPGSEVAVIGDIHGNDLRLDLTLKALQQRGFLDENFHCIPGKHIVFLGDYADRGKNTLKVLELLMTLKMENKDQVFLIRGNHEDLNTSKGKLDRYAANDPKYLNYMQEEKNLDAIEGFYRSLPVAVYLGEQAGEKREYIQFCHGLFHLYTDPSSLLDSQEPHAHLWVDGSSGFSGRINQMTLPLQEGEAETKMKVKQRSAATKLAELKNKITPRFDDIYWLDVGKEFKNNHLIGRVSIEPETIKAYLRVSGTETAKPKEIIRGHQQGGMWTLNGQVDKTVVTTIDPSGNPTEQMFMQIKLAPKIKNCVKTGVALPLDENHEQALRKLREDNSLISS